MDRKTLVLYSLGSIGQGAGYNIFICYFIYFLTMVAGVPPMVAGTISLIGLVWDAFSDPVIGFLSDYSKNKRGRRRGFIRAGSILLFFVMSLVFWDWPQLSTTIKIAYYMLLNVIFWLAYTITDVPYLSLGGEIAKTYEDNSLIRGYAYTCCNIGYILGQPLALPAIALFTSVTGSNAGGWRLGGVIVAFITCSGYYISYLGTKACDRPVVHNNYHRFSDIFRKYTAILKKNRSMVLICILTFLVNISIGIYLSLIAFLLQFNYALQPSQIAGVLILGNIVGILISVPSGRMAAKFGKKRVMLLGLLIYYAGMVSVSLMPMGIFSASIMNLFLFVGNTIFFSQIYSFAYDAGEVNRFHFGERCGGSNVALVGISYKIGTAIGMQVSGIGLQICGFDSDAAVQAGTVLAAIQFMFSQVSGGAVLLGLFVFLFYPLTRAHCLKLMDENHKKENGLEYNPSAADHL